MLDDHLGNLWLTSNRGVLRVSRKEAEAVLASALLVYDLHL